MNIALVLYKTWLKRWFGWNQKVKSLKMLGSSFAVFSLLIYALATPLGIAQLTWSREFQIADVGRTGFAYSVIQTEDGGYAFTVAVIRAFGDSEVSLFKIDSSGLKQWNQSLGLGIEYEYFLIQTEDGGYAIAGTAFYNTAGSMDSWLIKTDSNGNQQWAKTYGGENEDRAFGIVQSQDGGYALAGTSWQESSSSEDFWLVKIDSNGKLQWSQAYDSFQREDTAHCLIKTSDGGYALAGETWSDDLKDMWLVKTNSQGTLQWSQMYGTSQEDTAYSVVQTSDGGYALAGWSGSGPFGGDSLLVRTDGSGNMLWNQTYGGEYFDFGVYSVVQVNDGGYALAGGLGMDGNQRDFWLIRTGSSGNLLWNETYGGSGDDVAYDLTRTTDGGYALIGRSTDAYGVNVALLVKAAVGDSIPEPSPSPSPTTTPDESPLQSPSPSPSYSTSPTSSPSSSPSYSPEPTSGSEAIIPQETFYAVLVAALIVVAAGIALVTLKKQSARKP